MSAPELHERANAQVDDHVCAPDPGSGGPRSAKIVTTLVRGYQTARSGRPTGCRYLPSCSEYAIEAVEVHGAARGSALAVRRIARCGPWGGHGIDPVPERSRP